VPAETPRHPLQTRLPTHRCRSRRASPCSASPGAVQQALGTKLRQTPRSPAPCQQRSPWPCRLGCTPSPPQQGDPREEQQPRGAEQGATKPTGMGSGAEGGSGPARGSRGSGSPRAAPRCQRSSWGWGQAGCPERDRGLWLTDEPDGRLSHRGLGIPQVRQALLQVFLSPAPVPRQQQRETGTGTSQSLPGRPEQALLQHPPLLRPGGAALTQPGP